jgi:hypothetical protein
MEFRYFPPTRRSIELDGDVKSLGPHHFLRCYGSVQARQTARRGTLKSLVMAISFFVSV